jgi:hypothetical protein
LEQEDHGFAGVKVAALAISSPAHDLRRAARRAALRNPRTRSCTYRRGKLRRQAGTSSRFGSRVDRSASSQIRGRSGKQTTPCCDGVTGVESGVMTLPPKTFQVAHRQK